MSKYVGGALIPTLKIDRSDRSNLTMQLTVALRDLILSGDLAAGTRLPASRTLARDQRVSRTTVINAFDQLAAEGLIDSRVGAGTYVSAGLRPARPAVAAQPPENLPHLSRLGSDVPDPYFPRLGHPAAPRAFVTGMPAFDAFPVALWSRISSQYWRGERAAMMSYPDTAGLGALREAICQHLRANRGLVCQPGHVFVFSGAQDAFTQIGRMLVNVGDKVWLENPGAIGARNAFLSCGAEPVPVPVDEEGMDVAAGLKLSPDFRLAFVTPAYQHPLGVTLSLERRMRLLEAAEQAGAFIVEDDYVGEFHYGEATLPPLKALDGGQRVIYVGTFSKTLFPAVRLGFAVMPPVLVPMVERTLAAIAHGVAHAIQGIAARFIAEGHFAAHIRRMRGIYAARRDALMDASERHLAGRLDVRPTETGFHAVGLIPASLPDERAIAEAALAAGLAVTPLSRYALRPIAQRGVTLGFSAVPPAEIERGVRTLAAVIDDLAA
ncbi:PLP-dependent aminotransferase family protein [Aurantimonas sp. 22II-16-19i]|uniref:MocR-like pyridoxine biosynthesis transcription factor PdxR n=1 Tax=Aurantimonas sp. 22II-16-19i TaxID=1317114 RepID=UPI0009F7F550|nr:PLP-dependent aminotransferase family protein [Aurantimonas sp. 22II-16-19i]ORE98952.1 GntR family transcriptional regulator [Aurantimonas sp. 22II-16-19i]